MNTKELHAFCKVYEYRSINRAAKELFITAQGLSKTIQNLEYEFDVQLFFRNRSGVSPTLAGERLYQESRGLIDQISRIENVMQDIARKELELRIGLSVGVSNVLDIDEILKVADKVPDLKVYCEDSLNSMIQEKLENRQLNAAFVVGMPKNRDFITKLVTERKIGIVSYKGHRLYRRNKASIHDLEGEPLISLNEMFYVYHVFTEKCQECGFVPKIVQTTLENQVAINFVRNRKGLAVTTDFSLNELKSSGLRFIPLEDVASWPVYLIAHQDAHKNNLVKLLFDYCERNEAILRKVE